MLMASFLLSSDNVPLSSQREGTMCLTVSSITQLLMFGELMKIEQKNRNREKIELIIITIIKSRNSQLA